MPQPSVIKLSAAIKEILPRKDFVGRPKAITYPCAGALGTYAKHIK